MNERGKNGCFQSYLFFLGTSRLIPSRLILAPVASKRMQLSIERDINSRQEKGNIMVTITVTVSINHYAAEHHNGILDIETNESDH